MKITPKGGGDPELVVQSDKKVSLSRQEKESASKAMPIDDKATWLLAGREGVRAPSGEKK